MLPRHVQPVHRLRGPQQEAAKQRRTQHHLHASLQTVAQAVRAGNTDFAALEAHAMESLRAKSWQPDYVAVRRQADLQVPQAGDALVVLAAARLIDNLEI